MTDAAPPGTFTGPEVRGDVNSCQIDDRRGKPIVYLHCEKPGCVHDIGKPSCGFNEQYMTYASAAIGEGRCPWGDGPLTAIAGVREDEAGGLCGTCQVVWTTPRSGLGWAQVPVREWRLRWV